MRKRSTIRTLREHFFFRYFLALKSHLILDSAIYLIRIICYLAAKIVAMADIDSMAVQVSNTAALEQLHHALQITAHA